MNPTPPDPAAAEPVGDLLGRHGYTQDAIRAVLGQTSIFAAHAADPQDLQAPGKAAPAVTTLVRLLIAGHRVERTELADALGAGALDILARAGLVRADASQVEALCLLAPVDDILIAADRADRHPSAEPDYVVAPGPASRALARLMLPAPLKAALDLGCGTGYLACRLAARADRVVATDINPRAVAFSRFNAALNGLSNLKCRQGNLFEPLDGNRFDLIGCNPPYVIAPQSTYLYRDGGPGLCRQILAEAADHLAPDGTLIMGANWPHTEGGDWRAELAEWVDPSGCDAWILTGQTLDAASYAAGWIQQQTQDPEQARQDHIDWCDFLERQRITAVGSGYIILRRTDASPWFEIRKLPSVSGEAGAAVDRALRTRRFLHRQSGDEPLLHARLLAAPELERRDIADLVDGRWHTRTVELRLSHGLQFSARINALTGKLIERLDGSTSLIQAAAALMPPSELNADLQSGLAATARRLLELGLLEPVVGRPCPSS